MLKFCILVTRDIESKITSLYSPDFEANLLNANEGDAFPDDYHLYITNAITDNLNGGKQKIIPKSFNQLKSFPINQNLQHWELIEIEFRARDGVFSKSLPMMGHVTNMLSILCGGFITFMALRIASSRSRSENRDSSNALSVLATILSSVISLIMYTYSGATEVLTELGHDIDHFFSRICRRDNKNLLSKNKPKYSSSSLSRKFVSILTIGGISTNTLIAAISTYQEVNLLVDKYLDLYPDLTHSERQKQREILSWLIDLFIFVSAYSTLSFQGSFAAKLVDGVMDKCNKNKNEASPDDEDEELLVNQHQGLFFQGVRHTSSIINEYEPMPIENEQSRDIQREDEGASSNLVLRMF